MNCGVDCSLGWDPALLWLWCRPAATALIQLITWEPPFAMGTTLKTKKKKKERKKGINTERLGQKNYTFDVTWATYLSWNTDFILLPTSFSEGKVIVWNSKLQVRYTWLFHFFYACASSISSVIWGATLFVKNRTESGPSRRGCWGWMKGQVKLPLRETCKDATGPDFRRAIYTSF